MACCRERSVTQLHELHSEVGLLEADLAQVQGGSALQDAGEADQAALAGHDSLVNKLQSHLLGADPARPLLPGGL